MLQRQEVISGYRIKVEQDLSLSHAGTVWDGALVLAYFLQKNEQYRKEYIQTKNVLQLGSGTGFLGLACRAFKPKKIVLTDLPQFLKIIEHNVQINEKAKQNQMIQVKPLQWDNIVHMECIKQIDTIIGSELAYDEIYISKLIKTIQHFYKLNKNLKVIISYQKYENPERNLSVQLQKQFTYGTFYEVANQIMHETYQDSFIGILCLK